MQQASFIGHARHEDSVRQFILDGTCMTSREHMTIERSARVDLDRLVCILPRESERTEVVARKAMRIEVQPLVDPLYRSGTHDHSGHEVHDVTDVTCGQAFPEIGNEQRHHVACDRTEEERREQAEHDGMPRHHPPHRTITNAARGRDIVEPALPVQEAPDQYALDVLAFHLSTFLVSNPVRD